MPFKVLICSGITGVVCGGVGYLLQREAGNMSQEAKEMRKTSTTALNNIYRSLVEKRTCDKIFAEVYGKTWAPVDAQVMSQKGTYVVAKRTDTFECVEECNWIERKARKSIRRSPNGPLLETQVGTGLGDWVCQKKEKKRSSSTVGSDLYIFDQHAFVGDERERLKELETQYAKVENEVVRMRGDLRASEREEEFAKTGKQQKRAIARSHALREALREVENKFISISESLSSTKMQIEGQQDPGLQFVARVSEGGIGGGESFFELASEEYRPNESVNVTVNVNTNSSSRPAETFRSTVLGWYEREYVVPLNRDLYALGEFSASPLKSTSALVQNAHEMVLRKPRSSDHHYVCELGTESEIYDRKMHSAQWTEFASKGFYAVGCISLLGGLAYQLMADGDGKE